MKGGSIFPLAVTVAVTVALFVSVVDTHTWIVLDPLVSRVLLE